MNDATSTTAPGKRNLKWRQWTILRYRSFTTFSKPSVSSSPRHEEAGKTLEKFDVCFPLNAAKVMIDSASQAF